MVRMSVPWNEENARHLLRRAGFGPTRSEVEKWTAKGRDKTIAYLLKGPGSSPGFPIKNKNIDDLHADWLRRMVTTKRPLVEKMVLFWHDYFATAFEKVASVKFMMRQNKKLRSAGLGKFRALLRKVAKDPAMIHWLDAQTNVKKAPNQNFARELFELFSTGEKDKQGASIYTEKDVEEAARAFTGWHEVRGKFKFKKKHHDDGTKTVLGVTAKLDGQDVLDIVLDHPATPRRVAQKLFSWFAYDVALDDSVLAPLVTAYKENDTRVDAMLDALFRLDAFYSDEAKLHRVKTPAEFLVGSLRMLEGKLSKKSAINGDLAFAMRAMGQALFDPPSVAGWEDGDAWISTQGMLARTRVAEQIADAREQFKSPFQWKAKKLVGKDDEWPSLTAEDVVGRVLDAMGCQHASAETRDALVDYLTTAPDGSPAEFFLDDESFDAKVRGALFLVLSSPEYQVT